VPEDRDAYDAGHTAGGIDARLAGHDRHFARINGSLEKMASELAAVNLSLNRLADSADADRRTVVTTAAALKDADDARRDTNTDRWSPWQKAIAVIGAAAAVVGIVALILANTNT
jgi:hypothetical protein